MFDRRHGMTLHSIFKTYVFQIVKLMGEITASYSNRFGRGLLTKGSYEVKLPSNVIRIYSKERKWNIYQKYRVHFLRTFIMNIQTPNLIECFLVIYFHQTREGSEIERSDKI